MLKSILIGLIVFLVGFLGYVASRPGSFRYERSGVIQAGPDVIFPYLNNLRAGNEWMPYTKNDPEMKSEFSGQDGTVGSKLHFTGKNSGTGMVEIVNSVPNESVEMRLLMTAPLAADNHIEYRLTPETGGTRFSWSMSGPTGFLGKLMGVFIDCEKMVTDQFDEGIQNLKTLIESKGK